MSKLATAIDMLRSRDVTGLRATLTRALLPASIFRINELVILRLRERPRLPRPLERIRVRWATREDEEALQHVRPRHEGYASNFDTGSWCLLGEVDGEPASFNWFEVGPWHGSRTNAYRFWLGPHAAWAWGFEVLPRFRMTGIFVKQWAVAFDELAGHGIDTIYGAVQTDNPGSVAAHERLGFEELFHYRVTRVAGLVRHHVTPGRDLEAPEEKGWGAWIGRDPSREPPPDDR
jgi:GNAT superfamily N-acetyltransferase